MKIDEPVNANYAAVVVRVKTLNSLDNCDNVMGLKALGYQAIVPKDTEIDSLGILFPPETQLSEEYARMNNLFRHSDRNSNPDETGYLEDNRRVKAMKFRGQVSNALFMPLSSLAYTGVDLDGLNDGDLFDKLNKHDICNKYVLEQSNNNASRMDKNKVAKFRRVDNVAFPLHTDTDNYYRNATIVPGDQFITVTQKLHGTSVRFGKVKVQRELKFVERWLAKLGVKIEKEHYGFVTGSRRVIKSIID